jgi:hypothetical protein
MPRNAFLVIGGIVSGFRARGINERRRKHFVKGGGLGHAKLKPVLKHTPSLYWNRGLQDFICWSSAIGIDLLLRYQKFGGRYVISIHPNPSIRAKGR